MDIQIIYHYYIIYQWSGKWWKMDPATWENHHAAWFSVDGFFTPWFLRWFQWGFHHENWWRMRIGKLWTKLKILNIKYFWVSSFDAPFIRIWGDGITLLANPESLSNLGCPRSNFWQCKFCFVLRYSMICSLGKSFMCHVLHYIYIHGNMFTSDGCWRQTSDLATRKVSVT